MAINYFYSRDAIVEALYVVCNIYCSKWRKKNKTSKTFTQILIAIYYTNQVVGLNLL